MYIEFLILLVDYFRTLTRRIFLYEWLLPMILVFIIFVLGKELDLAIFKSFKDNAINILGVLLGFSIAIITIITTGSGKSIDEIKQAKTNFEINRRKLSLYELLLINFTYSVVSEIFIIISCLSAPILASVIVLSNGFKSTLYLLLLFAVIHILLLTLRNMADFYLIITAKR